MRNSKLVGLCVMVAILVGALFFNIIIGVFGLDFAIVGLAAFLVGAVVIYRAFPPEGAER
jgi:hypothetical protein